MAYRQLFAATFAAVGLCLAACSGGPAPSQDSGNGAGSEQPPASSETAPGNGDQPPGNPDQPPGNPDQPPGNPDQPPSRGGPAQGPGATTPCTRLCERFSDGCPGNDPVNRNVRDLCDDDCETVDGKPECAALVATAISCVSGLTGLCTEEGPDNAEACATSIAAAQDCTDEEGGAGPGCTLAGGCECGDDLCSSCRCAGGGAGCDVICE